MFEMVMTTPNMYKHPSILLQSGNDVATVHMSIIHIIHTLSISAFRKQKCFPWVEGVNRLFLNRKTLVNLVEFHDLSV